MKSTIYVVFYMLGTSSAVIYRLNDTEHDLMPPIVHLDPFERCLRKPGGVYCTGFIKFVSDEPSELYTQMQEYSEFTTRHFNYTRALYGTCISDKCTLEKNKDTKSILEACLNRTVWKNHKLRVLVEDEMNCIHGNNRKISLDSAGIAMIAICLILLMLNAIGSLYDVYFSGQKHKPVAYLLLCFSLRRSWRDLVASSDDSKDPREKRLQGMHGIRAMTMILVVVAHALMYPVLISDNPMFFEKQYDILAVHILINGTLAMQTFLILSAFLLVYNSLKAEEKHKASRMTIPMKILKRWLRLTPSYAIVLGVTATWLNHVGQGPLWDFLVTTESKDCRRYWWRHLLYINNYFNKSQCMPQTWFIAADFQLYCLGMTVYVFCQNPAFRNLVLSTLFFIGMVIPGLHTYFQDLDPTVIVRPSSAATSFEDDPTFNHVYKRGHTNIPSYMLGLALGYFIYKLQTRPKEDNYKKWRPVYWAMVPVSFGIVMLCKLFYAEGPRLDVCWRAAIASVIRPTFGLTMAVILIGTVMKIERLTRLIGAKLFWMDNTSGIHQKVGVTVSNIISSGSDDKDLTLPNKPEHIKKYSISCRRRARIGFGEHFKCLFSDWNPVGPLFKSYTLQVLAKHKDIHWPAKLNLYRGILEWRGWTTISRVSYSAYLLHLAFVRTLGGMQTRTVPGTYIDVLQAVLLMLVLTYISAYAFYLTVESPLNRLVKLCLEPKAEQKTHTTKKTETKLYTK